MSTPAVKSFGATPVFNYDEHVKELKEKFSRLIRKLGVKNSKGTKRYEFEVDFAYVLNELEQGPTYFKGKLFEDANNVANTLVSYVKGMKEPETEAAPT